MRRGHSNGNTRRTVRMAAVAAMALVAPAATAEDEATLPPEVRKVQQALGGPVVDQFPSLRTTESQNPWWTRFNDPGDEQETPATVAPTAEMQAQFAAPVAWPAWSAERPGPGPKPKSPADALHAKKRVAALRDTAARLDDAANRLENLDLYRQSDAIRNLAQGLRREARTIRAPQAALPQSEPVPTQIPPTPPLPPSPTPAPTTAPYAPSTTTIVPQPTASPTPTLEPSPTIAPSTQPTPTTVPPRTN